MRTNRPNRRRWGRLMPVLACAAVLGLAGCGGPVAGQSAAVLGQQQVSANQLDSYVSDIYRASNRPVDEKDADLVRETLQRLIIQNLVDQAAERLGVSLDRTELDERTAEYVAQFGDRAAMEQAFLESQIPPSGVEPAIRLSLLVPKIGQTLAPDADEQGQQQALVEYMRVLSAELGIDVNPRYGTWAAQDFQVGPLPDDLSIPLAQ